MHCVQFQNIDLRKILDKLPNELAHAWVTGAEHGLANATELRGWPSEITAILSVRGSDYAKIVMQTRAAAEAVKERP